MGPSETFVQVPQGRIACVVKSLASLQVKPLASLRVPPAVDPPVQVHLLEPSESTSGCAPSAHPNTTRDSEKYLAPRRGSGRVLSAHGCPGREHAAAVDRRQEARPNQKQSQTSRVCKKKKKKPSPQIEVNTKLKCTSRMDYFSFL